MNETAIDKATSDKISFITFIIIEFAYLVTKEMLKIQEVG